jgi:hypothetical protein
MYSDVVKKETRETKEKITQSKNPVEPESHQSSPAGPSKHEQQQQEQVVSQRHPMFRVVGSGSGSVVQNGWLTVAKGTAGHYPMQAEGAAQVIAGAVDVLISDTCTDESVTD